jgi:hypothetical protein
VLLLFFRIIQVIPRIGQLTPNMADAPEVVSSIDSPSVGHTSYSSPIKMDEKASEQSTEKILVEADPSPKYFVGANQNTSSISAQDSAQGQSNSQFTSPTLHSPQDEAGCRPLAHDKYQSTSASNSHTYHQGQTDGEWTFGFWDMLASKALCESALQHPSK